MRILYIECNMGAAGDMLSAALLELLPYKERQEVIEELNALGLPGVTVSAEKSVKCGITGTHMRVVVNGAEEGGTEPGQSHEDNGEVPDNTGDAVHAHKHHHEHETREHAYEHHHEHEMTEHMHGNVHDDGIEEHDNAHGEHYHAGHHHTSVMDIEEIVGRMPLENEIKSNIVSIYRLIAEAEGHAHGQPVENIHFHEVGTMDAIMDVTAFCVLMNRITPDQIIASPVRTGFGQVSCAHGILPVPAPATEYLLRGIPSYSGDIEGEMCTPTGAALLKFFVSEFRTRPVMTADKTGYGMGSRDFPAANCVRAFLGDTQDNGDTVLELCCNIDDMTGEDIGFAVQAILDAGANDVFTEAVSMKKGRPGTLLTVICGPDRKEEMIRLIFQNTTTLGIRERVCERAILKRESKNVETPYGKVKMKISSGWGVRREKFEYDDVARIARENGKTMLYIRKELSCMKN